ncbi:MAG: cyclic nucleotide-binding domain-containing protein [Granulosicoccus sp.]|nr:cyclic nucleotide-binding domain-containing protein [Granulosicoccus sp.]
MEKGLFAYILKYSKSQQAVLTILTIAALPFYYLSLDLPKTIINDAISGDDFPVDMSFELLEFQLELGTLPQIPYLLVLCLAFLLLVLVNSGFKLFINIYRGVMGERMLRRMRMQLVERIMDFPLARFGNTSQGELVSMVNQETEPLGGFIGESLSLPLYQGGLLLTILVFMFVQDWVLGLAAIALYPFQIWLIPKLQKQVNLLNRERTLKMRLLAERLGEVVAGINEIRVNDNRLFFRDYFSKALGETFYIRVEIYKKKFFIKFLNNSIAQLTPFLFYLIGGLLVIRGDLSIGALVAVLAAYKDLSPPWKELLSWYQRQADSRLRYTTLAEQFHMSEESLQEPEDVSNQWLEVAARSPIIANNVSLKRPDGVREVDNVSLSVNPGDWVSLVGTGSSGKNGLALLFARLVNPSSGRLLVAEKDATRIPRLVTGRSVGYVGHDSYLFSSSILENLLLSLKYQPQDSIDEDIASTEFLQIDTSNFKNWSDEARLSGNSEIDVDANWIDHKAAGAVDASKLSERIREILRLVDLEDDLVRYALDQCISPADQPELTASILRARSMFKARIVEMGLDSVVEFLDPDVYNDNASLAENILFGASRHEMFSPAGLAEHPLLRSLLEQYQLADKLDKAAISAATTTVELFSDLPAGHEFFERYSFVDAEDLTGLKRVLSLIEKGRSIDDLDREDRVLVRALPFRVVSGRHRMGIFDSDDKQKFLELRKLFNSKLDKASQDRIDNFSPDSFNALTPIRDNIIFGRIAYGKLGAEDKVHQIILEVLQSLELMSPVLKIGLSAPTGLGGSLLPMSQRQKLLLARALIKHPRVLVINEGLSALDSAEIDTILKNLKEHSASINVFWVDNQSRFAQHFNRTVYLHAGKLTKIEESTTESEGKTGSSIHSNSMEVRSAATVAEDEKIKMFRSIPLFHFLDDPHLRMLAVSSEALNIARGERLFNQGESGDAMYVVVDGIASILITDGTQEKQIKTCGVNEVFGELSLLSNEPRLASVEAQTDLALLQLKRDVFIGILQNNGELAYQILQIVVNRFVEANRRMVNMAQS